MQQCARQLTDPLDGFLLGKRYLIHDRDTKFTPAFDGLLKDRGVEPIVLPPRSPNLNAHCERFVRSIKEEALDRMVMLGEPALSYVIHHYLAHYHTERNHQGLDNQLIAREGQLVAKRVQWCGGHASVACSAIIIERQLDATQYFNHTALGWWHPSPTPQDRPGCVGGTGGRGFPRPLGRAPPTGLVPPTGAGLAASSRYPWRWAMRAW